MAEKPVSEVLKTYKLAVSSGSCSGVFWRGDPFTNSKPKNNENWPKNGSILKGYQYLCKGENWLKVTEIQQVGTSGFQNVAEDNKWMGYDGGASNGGKWLHDI
eukprot:CAMPEP_0196582944 /NCGR_PEP_ID=MMETSP1081-20130531/41371_1 /TAXON_ID=36882 /ORGANISM="Pyramimonas amylifera, Strain CCMP720" /LENGTH=102 /DNA_ID=CAMNT_0041903671 /DNA_START=67 /DNA_END=375 /DNA_ORIENTATION=+